MLSSPTSAPSQQQQQEHLHQVPPLVDAYAHVVATSNARVAKRVTSLEQQRHCGAHSACRRDPAQLAPARLSGTSLDVQRLWPPGNGRVAQCYMDPVASGGGEACVTAVVKRNVLGALGPYLEGQRCCVVNL